MSTQQLPGNVVVFGPGANCTLEICPVEWSVYQYRPSLPSNIIFLVIYALAMVTHIYLGIRWRSRGFMIFMILGCLMEIIGYVGRIILYNNPFSFAGFMLQIICITSGPVFFTASIYITLSRAIIFFSPEISRIKPELFWWIFIPLDVVCLILQAAGGALSTVSNGSSEVGVNVALAGLALQVAILVIFCGLFADYLIRYFRSGSTESLTIRMRVFFGFLTTAIVLILGRCAYRCYELSEGYSDSDLITDEGLFIGLEGVLIVLAVFSLCLGHPGLVFNKKTKLESSNESVEMATHLDQYLGRSKGALYFRTGALLVKVFTQTMPNPAGQTPWDFSNEFINCATMEMIMASMTRAKANNRTLYVIPNPKSKEEAELNLWAFTDEAANADTPPERTVPFNPKIWSTMCFGWREWKGPVLKKALEGITISGISRESTYTSIVYGYMPDMKLSAHSIIEQLDFFHAMGFMNHLFAPSHWVGVGIPRDFSQMTSPTASRSEWDEDTYVNNPNNYRRIIQSLALTGLLD